MGELELQLLGADGREVSYSGYKPVRLARTALVEEKPDFFVNAAEIQFDECLDGSGDIRCAALVASEHRMIVQLISAVLVSRGCSFRFVRHGLTVNFARRDGDPELTATERAIRSALREHCEPDPAATCDVCDGQWSLKRVPCPGCGSVAA